MEPNLKYIIAILHFSIIAHFQAFCHVLNAGLSFLLQYEGILRYFYKPPWPCYRNFIIVVSLMTTGHVPLVIITFRSFSYPWRITVFVTRKTLQVPHLEQERLALH